MRAAFAMIYRDRAVTDEPAAQAWLDEMNAGGRDLVDVWAAT